MSEYTANLPDLSHGYCVIDLETSGLNPATDRVIEVGFLVRKNGKSVIRRSLVNSVATLPREVTKITGITAGMLKEEGRPPEEVFAKLFKDEDLAALPVVGHNIVKFDLPFLLAEATRHAGHVNFWAADQALRPEKLVDTGALYKGMLLGMPPLPEETHFHWAERVLDHKAFGVYWNLTAAVGAYGIRAAAKDLHRARRDTILCQQLLERILKTQEA